MKLKSLVTTLEIEVQIMSAIPRVTAEELLADDGCYRRECYFSSGMWPLVGYPCLYRQYSLNSMSYENKEEEEAARADGTYKRDREMSGIA